VAETGPARRRAALAGAALALVLVGLTGYLVSRPIGRGGVRHEQVERPISPSFSLVDLDGKPLDLAALRGQVVLLDFWATWCGPCKFEIPGFIELYTKYQGQGLQVLGFAVDDPIPALQDYAKQMKMNYPILVGQGREDVVDAFGPMPGLPTTFIIGRDGKVCTSHTGFTEKEKFEEQIKALL
jgi:peroxiredoxin